jgi:two-component system, cell cycle sensor histidine kinase and response regulator CckA
LKTALKAAQAISGEIELNHLVTRIMESVVENAGAERGFLILERNGKWVIVAEGTPERSGLLTVNIEKSVELSESIVLYVARSLESVLLDDASHDEMFMKDPHIRQKKVKSLLCSPLVSKGKLKGVFYMENNLVTHAFTPDRIQLLEILFSEAATSLENARVYEALAESESKFRALTETSSATILVYCGKILYINQAGESLSGYSKNELMSFDLLDIVHPHYREKIQEHLSAVFQKENEHDRYEYKIVRKSGEERWIDFSSTSFQYDGQPAVLGVLIDITDRKNGEKEREKLEDQLRQSQKMESIGLLAGGIAHDFNNLLTPIMGYSGLLLMDMSKDDPNYDSIQSISEAAERARQLTQQLLAYSRKQMLELQEIDVGSVITQFKNMLSRTIRENIKIEVLISPDLGVVCADMGQIEQVLMNLAINAQDAMPEGGLLMIEAANVFLDETYARQHPEVKPGPYVMLAVSDSGAGMEKEMQEHIFEPFFTTKEKGKGTGLGLSTVYGIVKQHGGNISLYSELEKGSTFKVYLPRIFEFTESGERTFQDSFSEKDGFHGTETILVVEDNEMVRKLVYDILRSLGYKVMIAESVESCFALADDYQGTIHLLLSDVIMPKMNGKEIYTRLSERLKDLKVLYMTGYTSNVIVHHGVLDEGVNIIQKPLSVFALSRKVRQVLDSK